MAGVSWPSPTHNSRSVTDAEYGHIAPWNSDGIFPAATDLVYADSSGMQVHVRANRYGTIQGHAWWSGSSEYSLTVAANSSGLNRVDTVVLRLDRSTWNADLAVRQGTPGAGAPTLVRNVADTGVWEFPVADVSVDNGVASIAGTKVKSRTLLQSGAIRPCNSIADIQAVLNVGDLVYETATGRWMAWTTAGAALLYQDTGYQNLTITGLWSNGGFAPQLRLVNGVVYLRGSITRTTGTLQSTDTNSPIATIPAAFRPAGSHNWAAVTSVMGHVRLQVDFASGLLAIVDLSADITVGRVVYLDTTWLAG
jgi:hypothetical protein